MSRNIQAAGHTLFINDVRRASGDHLIDAGATFLDTARDVAGQSDIVLISVPGPDELEAVLSGPDGLLEGLKRGALVIDMTTI